MLVTNGLVLNKEFLDVTLLAVVGIQARFIGGAVVGKSKKEYGRARLTGMVKE